MEVVAVVSSVWASLVVAIIALSTWTYKLNRDLRSDLLEEISKNRREMSDNKQEILDHLHAHLHDPDSGEVLLRAMAGR